MSNIDLDLVEMRCKLRGWRFERTFSDHDESAPWTCALEIMTPDGHMYVRDDGEYGGDDAGTEKHELIITRPRLTLADIVASPPEGWTARPWERTRWTRFEHEVAEVWFDGGKVECHTMQNDCAQALAAHRAVAELLVLLGEVE